MHVCLAQNGILLSPLLPIILNGKETPVRRYLEPRSPCSHSPSPCSGDADTDHMTRWEKAPHLEGHKSVCSTYSLYCPLYRPIRRSSSERLVFRWEHGMVLIGSFLFMNTGSLVGRHCVVWGGYRIFRIQDLAGGGGGLRNIASPLLQRKPLPLPGHQPRAPASERHPA